MSTDKQRVAVAMSGGVDSSVAAALLVKQGFDVFGIMLRLWSEPGLAASRRDNRCCTRDQMLDAHFVAQRLGIPFEVIDARDVFKAEVVDRFIASYSAGNTPNPCLACNRHIRFTLLLNEALSRGATHLATGHYARVTRSALGEYELYCGADSAKDQSYVLSVLTQQQLAHALFPLGDYTKAEVRGLAESFGLPVAGKRESQDLCFVMDGDYRRFLRERAPRASEPGPIRRREGTVIGQHTGLANYTIGQRKGIGISAPEPLYVLSKDGLTNSLIVGVRDELGADYFRAGEINWISGRPPRERCRLAVKTRYKAQPIAADVVAVGDQEAEVWLEAPISDITPGQGAVFYDGDRVIGCGIISAANGRPASR